MCTCTVHVCTVHVCTCTCVHVCVQYMYSTCMYVYSTCMYMLIYEFTTKDDSMRLSNIDNRLSSSSISVGAFEGRTRNEKVIGNPIYRKEKINKKRN